MQHINLVRWLEDVVQGLGGTTFVARQELVRFDLDGWRATFYKKLQVSSKTLHLQGKSVEHSIV